MVAEDVDMSECVHSYFLSVALKSDVLLFTKTIWTLALDTAYARVLLKITTYNCIGTARRIYVRYAYIMQYFLFL